MFRLGAFFCAVVLSAFSAAAYASAPSKCVITIESVLLENDRGQWITVVSPDHQVDIVGQDPFVSFINGGRVAAGSYVNFKIILSKRIKVCQGPLPPDRTEPDWLEVRWPSGAAAKEAIEIFGRQDFKTPFAVKRGSFIEVRFHLDLEETLRGGQRPYFVPPEKVRGVTVEVDEMTRELAPDEVALVY